jgi:hypothetical protein
VFLREDDGVATASWQDEDRFADRDGAPAEVARWAFAQPAEALLVLADGEHYINAGVALPSNPATAPRRCGHSA